MKATELRIGNWCKIVEAPFPYESENREVQIEGITIHYFESGKDLKLEPIPLTEEWLLKFGFEESGRDLNIIHWYNGIIYLNSYEIDFNGYWMRHYQGRNHCKIIHVHQLQNLIFALTGTELEIK